MGSSTRFVRTRDGVRIACATHGSGPPLVFVRGWITHLDLMWDDPTIRTFFEALAAEFTLVRYDSRGNGLSDRDVSRVEFDHLVSDLEAVIDGLALDQVALWGSTYGGPVAIVYAARHADRVTRLVLEGTFADGGRLGAPDMGALLASLRRAPEPTLAAFSYVTDPEPATSHDERVRRLRRSIEPETAEQLYTLLGTIDVTSALQTLRHPVLVLHRSESNAVPFEAGRQLALLNENAELVALPGRSHNPWEPPAELAIRAMHAFLGGSGVAWPPSADDGPVTILFTDLVGSTALTSDLGDEAAQEILRAHDRIVRRQLDAYAGREIKHTGDGIMASFRSATAAVRCALGIQDEVTRHKGQQPGRAFDVRIGLNAGEPIAEDGDLFGTSVQAAARICDWAEVGHVAASAVVRDLASGKGFIFHDAGRVTLKGFGEPMPLFTVERETEPRR